MSLKFHTQDEFFEKFKKDGKKWFMKGEVLASDTINNETGETPVNENVEIVSHHIGKFALESNNDESMAYLKEVIIKNVFNDPIAKVKPVETEKKEIVISSEKSKLSLADEYISMMKKEENCMKLQGDEYDESRKLMKNLFIEIDTLFHNNYIPINSAAELKVLGKVPGQTGIEEIGISSTIGDVSNENPQELLKRASIYHIKGATERTKLDRKRKKKSIGQHMEKKKPKDQ